MTAPAYTVIEHPSDVGFELEAPDRARLYADAVLTYYDMLVGLRHIEARDRRVIEVEGSDDADLMVALLSECLVTTEVESMIFSAATVLSLDDHRLRIELRGEPIDLDRHPFELGVKAITYHELEVALRPDGRWHARVVLDI